MTIEAKATCAGRAAILDDYVSSNPSLFSSNSQRILVEARRAPPITLADPFHH
jgi:hypothetical protein